MALSVEEKTMRYLIAILLPWLGMMLCGKVFQGLLCLVLQLTCLGWPVAAIWAVLVVNSHLADVRTHRLIREIRRQGN
jgi:uncharacterized membrane protein YqaE (UPF0057 family)